MQLQGQGADLDQMFPFQAQCVLVEPSGHKNDFHITKVCLHSQNKHVLETYCKVTCYITMSNSKHAPKFTCTKIYLHQFTYTKIFQSWNKILFVTSWFHRHLSVINSSVNLESLARHPSRKNMELVNIFIDLMLYFLDT